MGRVQRRRGCGGGSIHYILSQAERADPRLPERRHTAPLESRRRELFYLRQDGVWSARVRRTDTDVELGAITRLFGVRVSGPQSNYAVAPDGQRFLVNVPSDSTQESHSPITVVLNWRAGLP